MKDRFQPTRERFLSDVADHQMTIELDQGVHRSIRFGKPDSSSYHFRLVTWPGYLAIAGDCEDYLFTRTRDMFEFFRSPRGRWSERSSINPSYWAEKVSSKAKHGGLEVYSEEKFHEVLRERIRDVKDQIPRQHRKAVLRQVSEELFEQSFSTAEEAVRAVMDFDPPELIERGGISWPGGKYQYTSPSRLELFPEFYEHNLTDWSYHFIWACRAIEWGIHQYDAWSVGLTVPGAKELAA